MSASRLLRGARADRPLSLVEHETIHGPMPAGTAGLIDAVERAGLRGRGGASFPTAVKLRAVASARGPCSVLVNAAEGEPMSAKDRVLLGAAPHLVLDGALAAAEAVGARRIVIAIREESARAVMAMEHAIAERGARRCTVAAVPTAYLAGEESALIRHLGGGPLKPTVVPPRPAERGLRRRPTLVQNPETLAHLALIARHGPAWFRQAGTASDPGTTLVTVSGAIVRPGVQEIPVGTPLPKVLEGAGGTTEPLRAVLMGGYHGAWISADAIDQITLDDDRLAARGARLAAGVVVALGISSCPVRELVAVMSWLSAQSARQCGPCSNGLPAIAGLLEAMSGARAAPGGRELLHRWGAQLPGRGACRLPDGAVGFLSSWLERFGSELAEHERLGPCHRCRRPTVLATPFTHAERVAA
jgi:NADH:ubiquinone oxidoreductase subunit F (NADH-binding)